MVFFLHLMRSAMKYKFIILFICLGSCSLFPDDALKKDFIRDYTPQFRQGVWDIAYPNISSLTSCFAYKWRKPGVAEQACNTQVMDYVDAALTSNQQKSRIYLEGNKVKGFINYEFTLPRYRQLLGQTKGENVMILHLAVDDACKNKGIGRALVNDALNDCRKRSASSVKLYTNGHIDFYNRVGFNLERRTQLNECTYKQRIGLHPLLELTHTLLRHIRK